MSVGEPTASLDETLRNLAVHPLAESVVVFYVEVDPQADDIYWLDEDVEECMADYTRSFRAGISALESHRHIRTLRFEDSFLHGASIRSGASTHGNISEHEDNTAYWRWRRRPGNEALARDFERFFHVVLPNHPTLDTLEFTYCKHISPRIVPTFLSGLPLHKRWAGLHFRNSPLCESSCRALAEALRQNAHMERLTLDECRLSCETCRMICDAIAANPHVRVLTLLDEYAGPFRDGALRQLLHSSQSGLKELEIGPTSWETDFLYEFDGVRVFQTRDDESWGELDDIKDLLTLVRTNEGLEVLTVGSVTRARHFAIIRKLVRTYNFSLRRLVLPDAPEHEQRRIDSILVSNERVRRDYQRLQDPAAPHKAHNIVLPEAITRICRFPTLVYRFVRDPGNAAILSGLVEQRQRRRGKRIRARPQRFEPC